MDKTLIVDCVSVCESARQMSDGKKRFHTIAKTFALSNRHDCFFICLLACFYSCVFCPAAKSKNKSFDISHIVPEETEHKKN